MPWGLEKLHLKGCQLHGDRLKLAHAMSQRALLATEAAEALAKGLEELRTRIKERRLLRCLREESALAKPWLRLRFTG